MQEGPTGGRPPVTKEEDVGGGTTKRVLPERGTVRPVED